MESNKRRSKDSVSGEGNGANLQEKKKTVQVRECLLN